MTKPPYRPNRPTAQQMLAQAQAALQAQQQAYLQQMSQQMTMYPPTPQPMGAANGRHRNTGTTTSSGTLGTAYITYVGTGGAVYFPTTLGTLDTDTQPAPAIEEAGIRAGEITGVRAWYLRSDDVLWSVYVGYAWTPGTQRIKDERLNRYQGNGFHAFKDMDLCQKCYPGPAVVYGEVALWGEVYEHERGYRAEWARVTRIISITDYDPPWYKLWQPSVLTRLRRKYGVEE